MKVLSATTLSIRSTALRAGALVGFCAIAASAQAQITRGFIGPHEYSLPDPVGMKPWNVFVEYSTFQRTNKAWNGDGDKVGAGKSEVLVSLSKFVHFWEVTPGVGIAMELIVPKVSIRDKDGLGAGNASGIADPIVGPAFWIKPSPNWTLGTDMFFVQIPIGDKDVSNDAWNAVASVFWDGQFGKFNWTGNVATTLHGTNSAGKKAGTQWYVNNRFGYRVSDLVEPFIGLDYERQKANDLNPSNHEWGGAVGVMFHALDKGHITVSYEKGLRGENRAVSNNLNLRFAYVF